MDEFASAVLVAAVRRALAEAGIAVTAPASDGALVPLDAKRRLLADVAEAHGLLPLLRVGLSLPTLPPDPAISALTVASTPRDLFERWSRLERFTHSRHRVVVREAGATHLIAEHVGPPGSPPEPAEDALILGLLTALLGAIGVHGLTVALDPRDARVVFTDGVFTAPPPAHATALWRFAWSSIAPAVRPTGLAADVDVASQARRLLTGNLARRWTLGDLAAELGTSTRSLQRRLTAGGFTDLYGAARAEAAADLLMNTEHPLGIVGFACGYADQPHFTREFRRRTAITPAAYRSAFARRCERPPYGRSETEMGT
ncbi:AraC family transcriptional regulator [Dactylosporangium fulvum]|uniref:AraC family transcriptional regulator n=1 Tax=Dactylosporangium fulvum TaxID=53359 RepID=A0ABY5VYP7_9ACTN|nr:AraC family transcriptional regulator [Dactylosporangium fulvum]UWP82392.1 AraC family transcriptional regulator [Dactylosporangium fulvum]